MTGVRPVLVLTHAPHEGPGLIGAGLDVPYRVRTVLDRSDPDLPAPGALSGLVVMGGPMDADDDVSHPGLPAERALLAAAVGADVPVLGVCLGMQLLAQALGAPLHRRHGEEIGFAPVTTVAADPVLSLLGDDPTVLHWHGDAVDLPSGATLLAGTEVTPVQAFRAGSALGLQFHVEVDAAMLDLWLSTPVMSDGLGETRVAQIWDDGTRHLPGLLAGAQRLVEAFAARVRERA